MHSFLRALPLLACAYTAQALPSFRPRQLVTNGTETTEWGATCRNFIIPVTATQTVEGEFSLDPWEIETLHVLAERHVIMNGEYELAARYCVPGPGVESRQTLQVLLHGATYNKGMWEFFYEPETYSYTRFMNLAGYSTLAVDLIGAGESSYPHGLLEVQVGTFVQTTHQVLQRTRSGELLGRSYDNIALVGFSLGGTIANSLVEQYPDDVDLTILLGVSWDTSYSYPAFLAGLQSAAADIDAERWGHLEDWYQTQSGLTAREAANFFGDYDQELLVQEFPTRDVDTLGAAITFVFHLVTAYTYRKPVFLGIGEMDTIFCGRRCGSEPYALYDHFPHATEHVIKVYENTGHALLYHRAAPLVMEDIRVFLDRHSA
ncbi:Alpha/Beta hydrolase protein [Stachybotrys elegans]|uniref:Alpha/Beta hydrolase protein n=1 Tax=Stachybotrys elegans TaxID=80388 RepID=A0A8K0WUF2_9HYPO|nr:Alpha/Beta hydrolase protein [Stachybotrys elegans]